MIGDIFPESSAVGTSYLSSSYTPNLFVSEVATVTITFVHEGAGYRKYPVSNMEEQPGLPISVVVQAAK